MRSRCLAINIYIAWLSMWLDKGGNILIKKNLATTITYCLDNPHKKEKIREQFARDLFYYSKSKTKSAVRAAKAIESFLEKIKNKK